jgi:hypothetical protein
MAEPDRPPGQRSLFDFGVRRVAEKRTRGCMYAHVVALPPAARVQEQGRKQ